MKMEESKPFEYMELKAMCMLCVAEVACMLALAQEGKFKDEVVVDHPQLDKFAGSGG